MPTRLYEGLLKRRKNNSFETEIHWDYMQVVIDFCFEYTNNLWEGNYWWLFLKSSLNIYCEVDRLTLKIAEDVGGKITFLIIM